ncbi:hypothetical protein QQF64_025984 [Cirrhinus molitorella]|uniref:Uncharacterized protein n=1 Tax=Cirrhinus molitorella TaxID=172907 RepID=A0ABR3NQL4_9TELE
MEKTDEDEDIMVLLFQDQVDLPEASDERYRARVEFFSDEIHKLNFSLRLKSVKTEDKGVYMGFLCCAHNGVDSLYFCIWICTSALLSDLLQINY